MPKLYRYLDVLKRTRFGFGLSWRGMANYCRHMIFPYQAKMNLSHFSPIMLNLNVTYRCNLRCAFCIVNAPERDSGGGVPDIDYELAKRILNSAVTRNVLVAAVTGGEPLLNKSVFEIIHEIKKRKIQCMLFTNGMLLKKYMSRLLDNGLDEINLSLYDHTLDQLKGVLPDLCKKFPYINITYVLLRSVLEKNPEQVREVISTCQESGCNSLRFNLCRPTNGDLSEVIDSYCNAYRDFVAESRARYKDLKIVFPEPAYSEIKGKQDKKCRIPWQLLYMDPDGRFGMCCANVQILEPCGNIFADSDIRSYNAPTLVEIREKLLAKDSVIPECCEKCGSMNGCINLL